MSVLEKTPADVACDDDPLYVPTVDEWERISPYQQRLTEDNIISALEREAELMGETTIHFEARASASEVIGRYFKGKGQKIFVASNLHTLYLGEVAFYPDLLVVFEVDDYHRRSWNVLREKKGLDFVLEILSKETKHKDLVEKLNTYARLGIPEYFIYDPDLMLIKGYELTKQKVYQEIQVVGQGVFSNILGFYLRCEDFKIRFVLPDGLEVPFHSELINRLNDKLMNKDQVIATYIRELEEEKNKRRKNKNEGKKKKHGRNKKKHEQIDCKRKSACC